MDISTSAASTPLPNVNTTTGRRYTRINTAWPNPVPPLTGAEAMSAVKRLYRIGTGTAFTGPMKLTSGNRYTYIRDGIFWVNPDHGWQRLVHDVSHVVHRRVNPGKPPHHWSHADLERRLAAAVITRGWLTGSLCRVVAPKPDLRTVRQHRVLARIAAWEAKRRRAEVALKKLYRQKAYYEAS